MVGFDFEDTVHGLIVTVAGERITSSAMSEGEIDYQINRRKADLDAIGKRMKAALGKRRPLILRGALTMLTGPNGEKRLV